MVPVSFSRAMEIEVIMAETSIRIMAMVPGTNMKALFRSALYIILIRGSMIMGDFNWRFNS